MKKLKSIVSLVLCAAMLLALCACGETSGTSPNSSPPASSGGNEAPKESSLGQKDPNVLELRLSTEPSNLYAFQVSNISDWNIANNIFDGLTKMNAGDSTDIVGGLAESWESNEDCTEWTFHLRQNVKWHDGTEFTAEDVCGTFDLWVNDDSSNIKGKVSMFDTWEAVDEYTVKLYLKNPYPNLAGLLAIPQLVIINPSYFAEYGTGSNSAAIVGTGAYALESWTIGESVVLKSFADHWRGVANIETVNFKIMLDSNAAFIAFQNGEIDEYSGGSSLDLNAVSSNPDIETITVNRNQSVVLVFNLERFELDVRRALHHAIDCESINIAVYDGLGSDARQLGILENTIGCPEEGAYTYYEYDAEKAVQLLAEAGYHNGDLDICILHSTSAVTSAAATAVQAMLSAVGVNATTEGLEQSAFLQKAIHSPEDDWDVYIHTYSCTGTFDPASAYKLFFDSNTNAAPYNYHIYPEADELDAILTAANSTADMAEAAELYKQLWKISRENAYALPMVMTNDYVMGDARLQGRNYDIVGLYQDLYLYYWEM